MKQKDHNCPICNGNIDEETLQFVEETLRDPEKTVRYMKNEWTFDIWQKSKKK